VYVKLAEAAKIFQYTYQAIIWIVKSGKVKAIKKKNRWQVDICSLREYIINRWKRVFKDKEENEMTMQEVAIYLDIKYMKVYNAVTHKLIRNRKNQNNKVLINKDDADRYKRYLIAKDDLLNGNSRIDSDNTR
jgi:hypothetical protein